MLQRFLVISMFVLLGSVASFAQNGTDNCPPDKVQVVREATIEVAGVEAKVKETYCEDKGNTPIDKATDKVNEVVDRIKDYFGGGKDN